MSSVTEQLQSAAALACEHLELEAHAVRGEDPRETDQNVKILSVSYLLWFNVLADLSQACQLSVSSFSKKIEVLVSIINSMNYVELADECAAVYDQLRRTPSSPNWDAFKASEFKAHNDCDSAFSRWMVPYIDAIYRLKDPKVLSMCLTACVYPFRTRVHNTALQAEMLESYLSVEEELAQNDQRGYDDWLCKELNKIIRRWLKDWTSPVLPALTSGNVFEGCTCKLDKYFALRNNQAIEYLLKREQGIPENDFIPVNRSLYTTNRVNEVQFVPKNATKLRTVTTEAVSFQYFQAGVQKSIYRYIYRKPYLRNHMPFTNQGYVRALAEKSSMSRTHATIDFSAASDRISWLMIRRVFANTRYLKWLTATRAKRTLLPDGSWITPVKAFSMGACMCFPTMTLLIAAIAQLVEDKWAEAQLAWFNKYTPEHTVTRKDLCRLWTVYGDDVIIPVEFVKNFVLVSEHLGLVVNMTKSFYSETSPYREACGIECYNGDNITPLRFPRTWKAKQPVSAELTSLIEMANDAYVYGAKTLRLAIIYRINAKLSMPRNSYKAPVLRIPYSVENVQLEDRIRNGGTREPRSYTIGGGLYSDEPTNFGAKSREFVEFTKTGWMYFQSFGTSVRYETVINAWLGHVEYNVTYASMEPRMKETTMQHIYNRILLTKYFPNTRNPYDTIDEFEALYKMYKREQSPEREESILDEILGIEDSYLDKYSLLSLYSPVLRTGWKPSVLA